MPFLSKVRTARPAALEVSAVSKRRTISLIISLVLTLAVVVPPGALAYYEVVATAPAARDAAPTAPTRDEEETNAEAPQDAVGAGEARPPKRKGNGFARALGAPFRALARLFGGGRKSETAKKPAPPPAQETAAERSDVKEERAPGESKPQTRTAARPAPVQAPEGGPVTTPAAPVRETASAPRNSELDR